MPLLFIHLHIVNKFLHCCAAGGGGGQGDSDDVARLHVELETKDRELHEKNESINRLVL